MPQTEFEVGVKHGEYLGEIIIGLIVISGGGSVVVGVSNTCKAVNFVAKTYKRVTSSPEQLLEDYVDAINDAF